MAGVAERLDRREARSEVGAVGWGPGGFSTQASLRPFLGFLMARELLYEGAL